MYTHGSLIPCYTRDFFISLFFFKHYFYIISIYNTRYLISQSYGQFINSRVVRRIVHVLSSRMFLSYVICRNDVRHDRFHNFCEKTTALSTYHNRIIQRYKLVFVCSISSLHLTTVLFNSFSS